MFTKESLVTRLSGLIVLTIATTRCGGEGEADSTATNAPTESQRTPRGQDVAGGATSDFTGDLVSCEATSLELPGDEPKLNVSVDEVVMEATGSFELPVRWMSACDGSASAPAACGEPTSDLSDLDGDETTVHITVTPTGEPARVAHGTETQPMCAQGLSLPAVASFKSDDGVLDVEVELVVSTECGRAYGIGLDEPLRVLGGRLGAAADDLPEGARVELTFGFFADRSQFDLYVLPDGSNSASWLLTSDLPPFGQHTHDLARTEVGASDMTIPRRECQFTINCTAGPCTL